MELERRVMGEGYNARLHGKEVPGPLWTEWLNEVMEAYAETEYPVLYNFD